MWSSFANVLRRERWHAGKMQTELKCTNDKNAPKTRYLYALCKKTQNPFYNLDKTSDLGQLVCLLSARIMREISFSKIFFSNLFNPEAYIHKFIMPFQKKHKK